MKFTINKLQIDTNVSNLKIIDKEILELNKSNSKFFSTMIKESLWYAKGATLKHLCHFLEKNYNKIFNTEITFEKFDFVIPINNLKKVKTILLNEYGILIMEKKAKIEFFDIKKQ